MSRLEELIAEYCPDGVAYRPLEQCCNILDNRRKPVTKAAREAGAYPYYGANGIQDYVSSYIFDGTFVLVGEDGSVVTPNGNPVVNWATGKIWVNNHAHIIEEGNGVLLRFLFHFLQTVNVAALIHGNIPKLTGGDFRAIKIPVPPLPVQREITRILDKFTELIADLTTELSYRKGVFGEIVDSYFESKDRGEVVKLKSVTNNESRRNKDRSINLAYSITQRGLIPTTEYFGDTKITSEDTAGYKVVEPGWFVYSPSRIDVGSVNFHRGNERVIVSPLNIVFSVDHRRLIEDYLLYYLRSHAGMFQILSKRTGIEGTGRKLLPYDSFSEIEITLPSINEQTVVVERFDTFKQYSSALENEIAARQIQYEYYRNKLLTFKERKA